MLGNLTIYLLINLRSPRDYVGLPFFRSFALSTLDGASVREAHCEQASTAVREAHCAQATVARLVTFDPSSTHLLFLQKNITNLLGMILLLGTHAEKCLLIYV